MPGHITWGCYMRSPPHVVERMDRVYQEALASACPAARDREAWQRARAMAAARWHIFHVLTRLPAALQEDRPRGETTLRQQLLAWLEAAGRLAEEAATLPVLGGTARTMAAHLRTRWSTSVDPLPPYTAFR
jgi:hypothetical protein